MKKRMHTCEVLELEGLALNSVFVATIRSDDDRPQALPLLVCSFDSLRQAVLALEAPAWRSANGDAHNSLVQFPGR